MTGGLSPGWPLLELLMRPVSRGSKDAALQQYPRLAHSPHQTSRFPTLPRKPPPQPSPACGGGGPQRLPFPDPPPLAGEGSPTRSGGRGGAMPHRCSGNWRGGSPLSNAPAEDPLQALAKELQQLGADRIAAALDRELLRRAHDFAAGLEAYRRHPFRRRAPGVPVVWQEGEVRLLDYGSARKAPAVFVIPSLINRYYVLDLLPEQSFLRHLAASGLRPFVVDWGEPGAAERGFTLTGYIAGPLDRALTKARDLTRGPVAVIGYCMGGLLALALALRRPRDTAALALLATPWDFHAERPEQARFLGELGAFLPRFLGAGEPFPLSVIQFLFLMLDPFLAERKFIRFAALDPKGPTARGFVV